MEQAGGAFDEKIKMKARSGLITQSEKVYQVAIIILLGLLALTCIIPMYYVLITSFVTKAELDAHNNLVLWPLRWTLAAYRQFFVNQSIFISFRTSVLRVAAGTILQLFVCSFAALGLSKEDLPGKRGLIIVLIASMFVTPAMIPGYLWALQNHTADTFWIYILPSSYSAFGIILFRQFFMDLPPSLTESAQIDGISEPNLMRYIILPLSKPIFATITLFCAVGLWNDYLTNMIYVSDQGLMTLAYYLQQTLTGMINMMDASSTFNGITQGASNVYNASPTQGYKMAAVVISTVPIVCIYPFLQKYFAAGMLTGAIKG